MKSLQTTAILSALTCISAPAFAACYTEEIIPAGTVICDRDVSASADFTNGCHKLTADQVTQVPATCQKMWVTAPASWSAPANGRICEYYGYVNADFNGVICGSANLQPESGLNYQTINDYKYDSPPMGSMGSYPIEHVGGEYIYYGSLSSGSFCSHYPTAKAGVTTKWVTARVCMQDGKVN